MHSAIDQRSTFFQSFAALARELHLNIAITYLEAHSRRHRDGQLSRATEEPQFTGIHVRGLKKWEVYRYADR
jgi:hypothetical protein